MVVNIDGSLIYNAIIGLYRQATKLFPDKLRGIKPDDFYSTMLLFEDVGLPFRPCQIKPIKDEKDEVINKQDVGKLTLEMRTAEGRWEIPNGIIPVDYLNL